METVLTKSDLLYLNDISYNFKITIKGESHLEIKVKNLSNNRKYKKMFSIQELKLACPLFLNKNHINEIYELFLRKLENRQCEIEENENSEIFVTFSIKFTLDDEKLKTPFKLRIYDVLKEKNDKRSDDKIELRKATKEDVGLILYFIKELALYEKAPDSVFATEEILSNSLFGDREYGECILAYLNGEAVGFALFFHNFSTWQGRPGLYLEDVYIKPEYRGRGVGTSILIYLAKLAKERNCPRFEWIVIDWNEPSIEFYKSLGAIPLDEWTVFRLAGEKLDKLAASSK